MRFGFTRREIKPVTKDQINEFSRAMEENKVGFKDKIVMILTAFVVIVLPCILVLGLISFLVLLLFGVFH